MTTKSQLAWRNGDFVPADGLSVPYYDLGVVAGASVTEMARTYGHRPLQLDRHVERLVGSLTALGFPCDYSADEWIAAAARVVEQNRAFCAPGDELGIVLFSTAGTNPTYLAGKSGSATSAIHTFRLPFELWRPSLQCGARLSIPSMRQMSSDLLPVQYKIRNRLHWWLADRAAAEMEPGSRALLLNQQGHVTETSTSCFHVVIDGEIVTSSRDVLNSLSSRLAEELAASIGLRFQRRILHESEIKSASEAFLTSTPTGLIPVVTIDRSPVGTKFPGPVFERLCHAWSERIGVAIPSA